MVAVRDGRHDADNSQDNFFDQMNDGRHPYFISIQRSDVINWQVGYERGRETVERVTVRQLRSVADEGYAPRLSLSIMC